MSASVIRNLVINEFAKRQTMESRFSHFEGTWAELEAHAWDCRESIRPSDTNDQVLLIKSSNPALFMSGIVRIDEDTPLKARYERRSEEEQPRKSIEVLNPGAKDVRFVKEPAEWVDLVAFPSQLLGEERAQLQCLPGNYEIISINASPVDAPSEIHPDTLIANHLELDGGTATTLDHGQFVQALRKSVEYWADKVMVGI